jgi:DNA-binding CsgD family transcriptional regulator
MKIIVSSIDLQLLRMLAEGMTDEQMIAKLKCQRSEIGQSKKNLLKRIGSEDPLEALRLLAKKGFTIQD